MWQVNGVSVCGAAGSQRKPKLNWDGSSLLLAWEDRRNAMDEDVYAGQLTGSGTVAVAHQPSPSELGEFIPHLPPAVDCLRHPEAS